VIAMPKEDASPIAVVVMGVAGSGKSVVGAALASRLGCPFVEGDLLHPPENVERMRSGQPLTDLDREGWLDTIGRSIAKARSEGDEVVAACSALKRRYRDRLRSWHPNIVFLYLSIDQAAAHSRVADRLHHFMPASLVDSQFADLEVPSSEEAAIVLDAALPVETLVEEAAARLPHGAAPLAAIRPA